MKSIIKKILKESDDLGWMDDVPNKHMFDGNSWYITNSEPERDPNMLIVQETLFSLGFFWAGDYKKIIIADNQGDYDYFIAFTNDGYDNSKEFGFWGGNFNDGKSISDAFWLKKADIVMTSTEFMKSYSQ